MHNFTGNKRFQAFTTHISLLRRAKMRACIFLISEQAKFQWFLIIVPLNAVSNIADNPPKMFNDPRAQYRVLSTSRIAATQHLVIINARSINFVPCFTPSTTNLPDHRRAACEFTRFIRAPIKPSARESIWSFGNWWPIWRGWNRSDNWRSRVSLGEYNRTITCSNTCIEAGTERKRDKVPSNNWPMCVRSLTQRSAVRSRRTFRAKWCVFIFFASELYLSNMENALSVHIGMSDKTGETRANVSVARIRVTHFALFSP